jgi:hypothetical protein
MQHVVSVRPDGLPQGLYRFKALEVSGGAWSKRQAFGCYLNDAARWIESRPSRRSKKGAHA